MFSSGFNRQKLKTNLRLSINRLKLLEKKKTELAQKSRHEIADYIATGKDDRARIRVEHIIREDYLVEAMEVVEMYCDLMLARFGIIESQKELDPGLEECVATLLWATPRLQTDVQELKVIFAQLSAKYGKEFAEACRSNTLANVNEKVMHKLGVQAPPKLLVERYMIEIARNFQVPFEPDPLVMQSETVYNAENLLVDFDEEMKNPNDSGVRPGGSGGYSGGGVGGQVMPQVAYPSSPPSYVPSPNASNQRMPPAMPSVPPAAMAPYPTNTQPGYVPPANPSGFYPGGAPPNLASNAPPKPPHTIPPSGPAPSYNEATNKPPNAPNTDMFPELPSVPTHTVSTIDPPGGGSVAGGEDVDFDDLNRRFEELKRKK